jgi:O-antigen ligase
MLAGAAVEALMGGVQFLLGLGPETFAIGVFMRAYGTFEQPNPYAGYLGTLIPLGLALLLARPGRWMRGYLLSVCLLSIAAVGMSLSRGAWVGIGLAIAVMALFWSQRSRILLATGAIAVAPLGALAFLNVLPGEVAARLATALDFFRFIDARQEVVNPQNWAVVERVAHWQAALDMIGDHPLLGVGAGNYPAAYENYFLPGWTEALGHAHNLYLNLAAETGIPGALIYVAFVATALIYTMRWLARSPRFALRTSHSYALHRAVLLGVLGALVASSVHNLFDSLFVHSMSVLLGMVLALGQVSASVLAREAAD